MTVIPLPEESGMPPQGDRVAVQCARDALIARLFREPESFSFGQLMRLLGLLYSKEYGSREAVYEHGVAVIPHLSLGFPTSDVIRVAVSPTEDTERPPHFLVTAAFMGLYGAVGPLPTFYTEELLDDEREDSSVVRDFLDIINQVLYRKYYQAHSMAGLALRTVENHELSMMEIPYCLLGMGYESLRKTYDIKHNDLGFISLFVRHNRSALGLEETVQRALGLELGNVEVEQCVPVCLPVPYEQRCHVGRANATLGEDTVLGAQIMDHTGNFRIHIRNIGRPLFEQLQPGNPLRKALERIVSMYLQDPLTYDVVLSMREGAFAPATLGTMQWSVLGSNILLLAGNAPSPHTTIVAYGG